VREDVEGTVPTDPAAFARPVLGGIRLYRADQVCPWLTGVLHAQCLLPVRSVSPTDRRVANNVGLQRVSHGALRALEYDCETNVVNEGVTMTSAKAAMRPNDRLAPTRRIWPSLFHQPGAREIPGLRGNGYAKCAHLKMTCFEPSAKCAWRSERKERPDLQPLLHLYVRYVAMRRVRLRFLNVAIA